MVLELALHHHLNNLTCYILIKIKEYFSNMPEVSSEFVKVASIGPIELNFHLCLSESDCDRFNLPKNFTDNFESISDCRELLMNKEILKRISISTSNSTINTLLFINRAFKKKTFIEYLSFGLGNFKRSEDFMKDVVKYVTEQNYLFIIESDIDLSNGINDGIIAVIHFHFKITGGSDTHTGTPSKMSKSFTITSKYTRDNNTDDNRAEDQSGLVYDKLVYDFETVNYFFLDLTTYTNTQSALAEISTLLKTIAENHNRVNIIVNYPDIIESIKNLSSENTYEYLMYLSDIISYTDIFIFERKEAEGLLNLYLQMKNMRKNEGGVNIVSSAKMNLELIFLKEISKVRKNLPKIGIFFDENFNRLTVLEQQANTNLVLFHSDFEFNLIPKLALEEEYKKILLDKKHYISLKFIFLGGFFSRLFNKKSFNTCFLAAQESVKRMIEIFRFNLDPPLEDNYYTVVVKKPQNTQNVSALKEDVSNTKREQHFVLDCVNKTNSKMKKYDPLYDTNLQSFFSSFHTQKHLKKMGFINRKGQILQDPDTKRLGIVSNKKLTAAYEQEQKTLQKIRENNQKMKLQINNLFNGDNQKLKHINQVDLRNYTKVYNFNPTSGKKLPSILNLESNPRVKSAPKVDLYAKAIVENKKEKMLINAEKKYMHLKETNLNLKPLSKESYLELLSNYESKVQI